MLGPAVVHVDIFYDTQKTRKYLEDYCTTKLNNLSYVSVKIDLNPNLILILPEYYSIKHVYSETKPDETENQIVIDKTVMIDLANCHVKREQNIYTIFTKRYQDPNIVGFIKVGPYHPIDGGEYRTFWKIDIHLMYKINLKKLRGESNNPDIWIDIPVSKYMDNGYLLTLPFSISDGFYYEDTMYKIIYETYHFTRSTHNYMERINKMHENGTENCCLVKNGRLYLSVVDNMLGKDSIKIHKSRYHKYGSDFSRGATIIIEE